MSAIGSGYDKYVHTYSRDGRMFQVEYAQKAVDATGTVIGARCRDGVVIAIEKLITSKMLVPKSDRRVCAADRHVGMVSAGVVPDARRIVSVARGYAAEYREDYAHPIRIKTLTERVAGHMHTCTLNGWARVYGISTLIAGHDSDGPQLYMVEPGGIFYGYYATAVGKAATAAKTELEKLKLSEMGVNEVVKELARILHSVHDDIKDKEFELEMGWIGEHTNRIFRAVPQAVIAEAEEAAKAALDDE